MPFVPSARAHAHSLPPRSVERCILEYLLENAVGRHNAVTWSAIEDHLTRNHHYNVRQQTFQQGLLKQSRIGDVFIGSNDHGTGRGYFLIQDIDDARVIRDWYRRRIQTEQGHLDHLHALMQQEFGTMV